MLSKLRFLCLALAAALTMSAVAASMTTADVFTAEAGPVTLEGDQDGGTDVMKVHGGEVKCSTVTHAAVVNVSGVSQITSTPSFSGCTFAGLAASVNMNGCDFLIKVNPAAGNTTGTMDVVCAAGKEVTVTAPSVGTAKCIIHIPAQTGIGPASGANIGAGTTKEVTASINATNIKYSQTAGTAETGNCATADNTTGATYTGRWRFTARIGPVHISIFLS